MKINESLIYLDGRGTFLSTINSIRCRETVWQVFQRREHLIFFNYGKRSNIAKAERIICKLLCSHYSALTVTIPWPICSICILTFSFPPWIILKQVTAAYYFTLISTIFSFPRLSISASFNLFPEFPFFCCLLVVNFPFLVYQG